MRSIPTGAASGSGKCEVFTNTLLALVGVHLSALALSGLIQRRNLARPMFDGRTPAPVPTWCRASAAAWRCC